MDEKKFLNLTGLSSFLANLKKIFATAAQGTKADEAYTHAESAHAPSNAERNVIIGIKKNGSDLTPDSSRKVNITVPTKVSELTNDSGYKTTDTTYENATTSTDGLMSSEDKTKLDGIATGANKYVHPSYTSKASGLYKVTVDSTGHVSATSAVAKSDITALGIPESDTNTWTAFKGATSSAVGTAGYVPAPAAGASNRYFRSDGTWAVPPDTNTTYSNMTAATSSAAGKAGLVPAPAAGAQTKYLRGDGTWQTPPNTTYNAATTSTSGLMSAADKTKLDGIAAGANKYTLPTASSSTLGGVKTTSTVTSTSGLTACPIISGVPYYKDTNTTYSLSSFGITATATELNKLVGVTATADELNYVDGVTSNIQTQLNSKAASSHNHSASNITSGTLPLTRGGTGGTTAASARSSLGAVNIICQSSEPSQNTGDFWFKEV